MILRFSYSFDRETFRGLHDTRQDALKKGLEEARLLPVTPEAVYVGKRVPVDPGTAGLAEMILGAVRRRLRDEIGNDAIQPLVRVNEHQLAELDDAIDRVVRQWLAKHELTPTQSKVVAISEHPVPLPSMTPSSDASEVGLIGETNITL